MKIELKYLHLQNFKGCKEKEIHFDGNTNIYGDNGKGKSTVYDAFSWLLFDKNSSGETKFEVKPFGIERPEVTVSGIISVDGKEIELKKTLTESWTKKRGEETETFTGHTSEYWINQIPKKVGEYKAFIDALVTEETFKRLTNANYFLNSKKPEMRSILIDMVGNVSNYDICAADPELLSIAQVMKDKGYSIDDLMKLCKQNVALYTKEQDSISPRIDENRLKISVEVDYSKLEENLATGNSFIAQIDAKLSDARSRVQEIAKKFTEQKTIESQIAIYKASKLEELNKGRIVLLESKNKLQSHATALKGHIDNAKQSATQKNETVKSINAFLLTLKEQYLKASAELKALTESVFVPIEVGSTNCNSCRQVLPVEMIDQMNEKALNDFNLSKMTQSEKWRKEIETITLRGKEEGAKRTVLELELKSLEEDIATREVEYQLATSRLQTLDQEIASHVPTQDIDLNGDPEYDRLYALAMQIQTEINETQEESTEKLISDKSQVQLKIDEIKAQLSGKTARAEAQKRIEELTARGKELASLISAEKSTQYKAEKFMRAKAEKLQDSINAMFENLSFRLFDVQINGGITDDCTPLINGVEYKDASHSEQIRAGMDIINAFQRTSGIYVPVFIDNAEACTHLRKMDCQIIKLIVSEQDKTLRIESEE